MLGNGDELEFSFTDRKSSSHDPKKIELQKLRAHKLLGLEAPCFVCEGVLVTNIRVHVMC